MSGALHRGFDSPYGGPSSCSAALALLHKLDQHRATQSNSGAAGAAPSIAASTRLTEGRAPARPLWLCFTSTTGTGPSTQPTATPTPTLLSLPDSTIGINAVSVQRCHWANNSDIEADYHDREWGVPVHDERRLFEFLTLEGAQAGLSWRTVLAKRAGYARVFLDYDLERLANLDDSELEARLLDPGIVRNRLKVWSVRSNARAALALRSSHGSLDSYLWAFVDGQPILNHRQSMSEVPARTEISDRLSKDLSRRGFKFVGSTIIYAFMQATGMVNDHVLGCHRYGGNP